MRGVLVRIVRAWAADGGVVPTAIQLVSTSPNPPLLTRGQRHRESMSSPATDHGAANDGGRPVYVRTRACYQPSNNTNSGARHESAHTLDESCKSHQAPEQWAPW